MEDEAILSSMPTQRDPALEFIQNSSSKVTDVLLNAKADMSADVFGNPSGTEC